MNIKFQGNPMTLKGNILNVGDKINNFKIISNSLEEVTLNDLKGKKIFLTVPSLDTPVCDLEVKTFNKKAEQIEDVASIIVVSMDLPFAQARWCGLNNTTKVKTFSDYKFHEFAQATGTYINELGLLTRAVIVTNEDNEVIYTEYLEEITNEPNYQNVLDFLTK